MKGRVSGPTVKRLLMTLKLALLLYRNIKIGLAVNEDVVRHQWAPMSITTQKLHFIRNKHSLFTTSMLPFIPLSDDRMPHHVPIIGIRWQSKLDVPLKRQPYLHHGK